MSSLYQFSSTNASEEAMKKTWNEFREKLLNGITTLDEAKQIKFLSVFDDAFEQNNVKRFFSKNLGSLINRKLYRGTVLKGEKGVPFDRYIPKAEFIKDDRRFSPAGVEWLYMGISKSSSKARSCCIKECRAKHEDYYGLCQFIIKPEFYDTLIVDLTVGLQMSFDKINNTLDQKTNILIKDTVEKILDSGNLSQINVSEMKLEELFSKWFTQTYTKIMSEQLFVPLDKAEPGKEYLPFQWIARYFKSLGFMGIIYKSTVCPGAKNIVLFDKTMATPVKKVEFVIR